jgi:hypothetical protein
MKTKLVHALRVGGRRRLRKHPEHHPCNLVFRPASSEWFPVGRPYVAALGGGLVLGLATPPRAPTQGRPYNPSISA